MKVNAQTPQVFNVRNGGSVSLAPVLGKGPAGADGSNVLPTDTAIANAVNTPASATATALGASYVAKAPKPSGSAATDQANLQPLFDAAIAAGGGRVILQPHPSGTAYQGDYTIGDGTNSVLPSISGAGAKLNGTLTFRGATAAFTGAEIDNLQMTGTRAAGVPFWTFQGCVSVKWRRIKFSGTADVGILFHNKNAGEFTEMCSGVADFGENIKRKVEYRVTSGNPSFHGCGVEEGTTFNQSRTQAEPEVYIGAGAEPYNCPLSATFWAVTAQPLIKHLGMATSSFYGNMKIELLPSNAKAVIVDTASTSSLSYIGTVQRRGKRVDRGKLVIGDEAITETFAVRTRRGGADVAGWVPGNVLTIGPDGNPEWVPKIRTNRAKNPVAGDTTTYVSSYAGIATVAAATDSALDSTKLWTVTTSGTTQNGQGFTYLQPGSDLAQGQTKTIAFDILSPVDTTLYVGGRFGLSGSPGIAEVGQQGATGDVEYVAANTVQRIRRVVTVPPPNSGGTITHEGFYFRFNAVGDLPASGTVLKVGNVTIEDGVTAGSRFSGEKYGLWTGAANLSTSVQYPTDPGLPAAEVAYTPSLTNITLGSGELAGYYSKVGKRVTGSVYIKLAADSAVSGSIRVGLPADAPIVAGSKRRFTADGWMNDFSISQRFRATGLPNGVNAFDIQAVGGGANGYHIQIFTSATVPFTWAVSDEILVSFQYETL